MSVLYTHYVKRMLLRCKTKYLKLGSAKMKVACRLTVSMHICIMILSLNCTIALVFQLERHPIFV